MTASLQRGTIGENLWFKSIALKSWKNFRLIGAIGGISKIRSLLARGKPHIKFGFEFIDDNDVL